MRHTAVFGARDHLRETVRKSHRLVGTGRRSVRNGVRERAVQRQQRQKAVQQDLERRLQDARTLFARTLGPGQKFAAGRYDAAVGKLAKWNRRHQTTPVKLLYYYNSSVKTFLDSS